MSFLWHKDATKTEIICTLFVYLFCITGIFSFYSNFTPSEISQKYSIYIIFLLSIIFYFPSLTMTRNFLKFNLGKKIFFGAFLFVLVYISMYLSLAAGIPAILVKYVGNEFTYKEVITEKKEGYWQRRGCDYEINVNGYNTFIGKDICVTERIWNSVEIDQSIELVGKEFFLGKRILSIRYEITKNGV